MSPSLRRGLPYVAPALLAALAGLQIVLAHTVHLSPWKGGGYGMFSTTDHSGFRTLRAFAALPGGERRVPVPAELRPDVLRALDLPSAARLERLARSIAAGANTGRVRVEVWRLEFDATLTPTLRRFAAHEAGP